MTIWRMDIICWISEVTYRHLEYVIFIPFLRPTVIARTRLNVMLHVDCLSCLYVLVLFTAESHLSVHGASIPSLHNVVCIVRRVRIFAKSTYYLRHFFPFVGLSVCLHVPTQFTLDGFPLI